jgi:fructuronate reductase
LKNLPASIRRPGYDPAAIGVGVVHLGPGAFHRVHQADALDRLLALDPRWGIAAVSLRSSALRDALNPQDGLYTLAEIEQGVNYRVIGAMRESWVAAEDPARLRARLQDPALRTVTLTVTEKGYCLAADGRLDWQHADIQHDVADPGRPRSVPGLLATMLADRKAAGVAAPVVLSCDNLTDNGRRLRTAVVDFATQLDAELGQWIAAEVAFPCTMVDSITPATTDTLRSQVAEALGAEDAWPVQREPFTQWIIEDDPRLSQGPDWVAGGAVVTSDVAGFEQAKLRLLNGAHSTLAYVGLLRGHQTVRDAMEDPELSAFVERMMLEDILPQVRCPPGFDAVAYVQAVLRRFRNPSLRHELAQIAWDGSQKLPFRLLGTTADALRTGANLERLAVPVAAWMRFLVLRHGEGREVVDPLAAILFSRIDTAARDSKSVVEALLELEAVFPAALHTATRFREAIQRAYDTLPRLSA